MKTGSIPEDVCDAIDTVPVGALVKIEIFLLPNLEISFFKSSGKD
jgi:hypothetical protein